MESVCCVPFQDSSKTSRKVSDKWVQTRGYQACVFCVPIPLRVCLARAAQEVRGTSDLRGPEWNVDPRVTKLFYTITEPKKLTMETPPKL